MEYRLLRKEESPLLRKCMQELADYHNEVALSFAGKYPMIPVDEQLAHMAKEMEKDTVMVEAAVEEGEIVGFCMAAYEARYGEIDFLYLREPFRGEGAGKQLVEDALAFFRKNGVRTIDVRVVAGNPAKNFYENLGFHLRSEVLTLETV